MESDFQSEALVHMDALYRYAGRLTGNQRDAEDLLQESYLRAYRFWDKYKKGTNCKAWLYRIMKNLSINTAQSQARKPQSTSLDATEEWYLYSQLRENDTQDATNPEKLFFERNWSPQVKQALEQLSPEFREPLILCDVEGFSYQEMAELLKVPIGTIRSRLNRARGRLQKLLAQHLNEL